MPIIGSVGRRSLKVRFLNASLHLVLLIGGITMIYPLLIMLSGSVKSAVDSRRLSAIPAYFYDDDMLYRKWIEAKYNETVSEYSYCYRDKVFSFEHTTPPETCVQQRFQDWNAFVAQNEEALDENHRTLAHCYGVGIKPELLRKFSHELKAEPDVEGDITRLNDKYMTNYVSWEAVSIPVLNFLRKGASSEYKPIVKRILRFAEEQGEEFANYYSLDSFFVEQALKTRYGQNIRKMNKALGTTFRSWSEVTLAETVPGNGLRKSWIFFVKKRLGLQYIRVSDAALPAYREFLREKYKRMKLFNERYGATLGDFSEIRLPAEPPRSGSPSADWSHFVESVAKPEHLRIVGAERLYRAFLKNKYESIDRLIAAHQMGLGGLDELKLTEKLPEGNVSYEDDWIEFVSNIAEKEWITPLFTASREWRTFLAKPYTRNKKVDLDALNAAFGTDYKDAKVDITVPTKKPEDAGLAAKWREFIDAVCSKNLLRLDTAKAEAKWRTFISGRYDAVEDLNRHYAWYPASFEKVAIPTADIDFFSFKKVKRHAFWEFLTRNYSAVAEMMIYNGRAVLNTIVYCGLLIMAALIVNPLAAYALSRYKPPSQYKLLLFLMLTMAFPPMVLGIPNFLILRKLNLLNTFFALVLPAMANGYRIFLLKGFFDALPRELYESAQIDGASEWTMFWHITMATSKPILAVIALRAFRVAYANFMLAFIVCQNPKMWTMMVHIYQLMQRASQGVSFAALVVAAIPTLAVFVFCQNIIIRGIVVPTEK